MTFEQNQLWRRIESFPLDEPSASFPYSNKLAKENGWSPDFAKRVIEEYRRFAFLSATAGHPVSPSDTVDQAWHMHMTYTVSYWKHFCPEALGKALHHHPSQGGKSETDKFEDWYGQTLESYRKFFGEQPPTDIWPPDLGKQLKTQNWVRVDRNTHFVLRKPELRPLAAVPILAAVGCAGAVGAVGPLDWRGPEFLQFIGWFTVGLWALAYATRWVLSTPADRPNGYDPTLDPYELAYLKGGARQALLAVISALTHMGVATVGKNGKVTATGTPYTGNHPFESAMFDHINTPGGKGFAGLNFRAALFMAGMSSRLENEGLKPNASQNMVIVLAPLAIASLAPILAFLKIQVGIERERPVGFLIFYLILAAIAGLAIFARRPARSRFGDKFLAQYVEQHEHLKHLRAAHATLSSGDVALAVGLFGTGALVGTELEPLRRYLNPQTTSSGSDGGCSSSGCSGGGDGGGGGGCGGGCGGCGG